MLTGATLYPARGIPFRQTLIAVCAMRAIAPLPPAVLAVYRQKNFLRHRLLSPLGILFPRHCPALGCRRFFNACRLRLEAAVWAAALPKSALVNELQSSPISNTRNHILDSQPVHRHQSWRELIRPAVIVGAGYLNRPEFNRTLSFALSLLAM